jgi:sugar lactone lactonase YvrE
MIPSLLSLAALCFMPLVHDGHHGSPPATAPTLEQPVEIGRGPMAFRAVPGWCRLPSGRPLGNTHGGIVIDASGHVYFNTDTERSVLVYDPDGRLLRTFGADHVGIHGMTIREEGGRQYIYAAHLGGKQVIKLTLDGAVVWTLGVPMESGKYDDDPNAFSPTAVAVGPDGDLYVADGYGRNWIHQFTSDRAYVRSFGGPGEEPGRFRTCHGLAIDDRGDAPVLLVCDRENRRLQRFDLEGNPIDVPVTGLRRPCSVSFWGEYLAVAELEGRVTVLDRGFEAVARLGDNSDRTQWANNGVKPEHWTEGVFTAPHACCFDAEGNLYVMDWNASGRISKLRRRTPNQGAP